MSKFWIVIALLAGSIVPASAQKFFSRDANVQFFSNTPMEKIEAVNKSGTAVLDAATGRMEWKVLIKGFLFEKALMQEHFNENYMESNKFPSATFKGSLTEPTAVNYGKDGSYKVSVKGKMNIHGVERDVEVPGTITVKNGKPVIHADFLVVSEDYGIAIPAVVRDNIAKEIKVTVDATLNPM